MKNFESHQEQNKEKTKYKKQLPDRFNNPDGTSNFTEFTHDIEYLKGTLLYVPGTKQMFRVKEMSNNHKNLIRAHEGMGAIPIEDVIPPSDEQILSWCKEARMSEAEARNFLDKQHDLVKKAPR